MKKLLLLFVILVTTTIVFGQKKQLNPQHYLFPEYKRGIIYLKEGGAIPQMLNYNLLLDELEFYNEKDKREAVYNFDDVEYVNIGGRNFIPLDRDFGEIIKDDDVVTLAVKRFTKISRPGKVIGGMGIKGKVEKLLGKGENLPEGVELHSDSTYYLIRMVKPQGAGKGVFKGMSLNQNRLVPVNTAGFLKVYDLHRVAVQDFISNAEIDFKKEEDLIKLIDFCNSL